jgi:hypothetical protein
MEKRNGLYLTGIVDLAVVVKKIWSVAADLGAGKSGASAVVVLGFFSSSSLLNNRASSRERLVRQRRHGKQSLRRIEARVRARLGIGS